MTTEVELLRKQVEILEKQIELSKIDPAEYTLSDDNPLSNFIYSILNKVDQTTPLEKIYSKFWNVFNYMLICGVGGTFVNYMVLSFFVNVFPLLIADLFAIITAALWNYTFTVGPMGYMAGLSIKKANRFKKTKEWT